MADYKLCIFDMGNVLAKNVNVIPDIIQYLNISREEFNNFTDDELMKYSDGKVTSKEFWQHFSKRSNLEIKEDLFRKFFKPEIDQNMVPIIDKLKKKAKVVCGTNTIDSHYYYHLQHGDYSIFEQVYASNKIGISKPNIDFFKYILKAENANAKETIFIDDMEKNTAAANKLGIKTIQFKNSSLFAEEIFSLV